MYTAQQLIDELASVPPDTRVLIESSNGEYGAQEVAFVNRENGGTEIVLYNEKPEGML